MTKVIRNKSHLRHIHVKRKSGKEQMAIAFGKRKPVLVNSPGINIPPTILTECIHQEQYCTDTYNQAKNNRIPSLANVNPLEQTIDNRKTIGDVVEPGL
jgi:hypothetical protein